MEAAGIEDHRLPFPPTAEARVLGVQIDYLMTMDRQVGDQRAKALLRQGLLARASRQSWGLGTGLLRVTHSAVITSILRYGLAVLGSCMPPDLFDKLGTCVADVAARRVTVLLRRPRIGTLRIPAATQPYADLYVTHCAELADAGPRVEGSSLVPD